MQTFPRHSSRDIWFLLEDLELKIDLRWSVNNYKTWNKFVGENKRDVNENWYGSLREKELP